MMATILLRDVLVLGMLRLLIHCDRQAQRFLGRGLPGISLLSRQLRNPFLFKVSGRDFAFNPESATAYRYLLAGLWNEPETHILFDRAFSGLERNLTFIDVGSSVGEMVLDVARHEHVERIIAFEPLRSSAEAIQRAAEENRFRHIEVRDSVVSDQAGVIRFSRSADASSSHVAGQDDDTRDVFEARCTTLDVEFPDVDGMVFLLIDTEGNELRVLNGGRELIARCNPLVVFEYNWVSRNHFTLDDVRQVMGNGYEIFRLRKDGYIDSDFVDTWNCVALPREGPWSTLRDTLLANHEGSRTGRDRERKQIAGVDHVP